MRLFIVERTPLRKLSDYPNGPEAGDVVAYFRAGQAPDEDSGSKLADKGVNVFRADTLLDKNDIRRIDQIVDSFTRCWLFDDGVDVSQAEDISIGMIVSPQLITAYELGLFVHSGEIFSKISEEFSPASGVLSDIIDGETLTLDNVAFEECCPRWRLLLAMANRRG